MSHPFGAPSHLNVTAAAFDVTGLLIDMWQLSHVKCDSCHIWLMKYLGSTNNKIRGAVTFDWWSTWDHPLWITTKLGMDRYCDVVYMPTRLIRDSDAIRVYLEFRDSSLMDYYQIRYGPLLWCALYTYRVNSRFGCHSSMFRVSGLILNGLLPN